MKTNEVLIDNHGSGMDDALREVEKFAVYQDLSHKDTLRLRLLAEEMMGMVRSVAGDFQACFWAEGHGRIWPEPLWERYATCWKAACVPTRKRSRKNWLQAS